MTFLLENSPADHFADFWIDERFPAADAHDRGAAFVHGVEALVRGEHFGHVVGILADPPAAGTVQIALEKRLEHQNERVFLHSPQALRENVTGHRRRERKWKTHKLIMNEEL